MFVSSATSRRSVAFCRIVFATTASLGAVSRAQDAVPTEKEQAAQPVPRPVLTDLDVSGTIVDEEGKPVHGVSVSIIVRDQEGTRILKDTVDGEFTVKQDDTIMVSLRFKKDGYYEVQFLPGSELSTTGRSPDGDRLTTRHDLRVVLETIGPATTLARYTLYSLHFNAAGESAGRGPIVRNDGPPHLSPVLIPGDVRIDLANGREEDIPEGTFYIRAAHKDGAITTIAEDIKRKSGVLRASRKDVPAGVKLFIAGKGSGFIPFDPGDTAKPNPDHTLRQLKEAPESGYKNTLELPLTQDLQFFTCKVGRYYGKGYVPIYFGIRENGTVAEAHVFLYLQPDGSRNIRSPGRK